MPAMSLGVADYQVQIGAVTPVIANLPLASALSATDRIAAAESINTRRDWEAVLMTMLVLLLLLAISLVDAGRGLRATFLKPGTALEVYEEHKSGVARLTPFSSVNSPPPTAPANDSTRGVIAASAFLCEQLVTALSIAGILWVALCMMTGPRWRRPAIVLLWFFCGAVLVSTFAFGYLADVEQIWLASRGIFLGPARNYGHVPGSLARQLELAILPALLIVALTRPSMRTLFEQRVRKLRKRSA